MRLRLELGVVIIGRNEGERLQRCLLSTVDPGSPVVYVDSGSTDGSVAFARSLGVEVVELDMVTPFTAARARNAGLARLLELHPDLSYVQFVDGDCEMVPDWLNAGVGVMAQSPEIAALCGRLRERHPEVSVYNRLCDVEWNGPVGEVDACGGVAMYRVASLKDVGGFDSTIPANEEPELCMRLRNRGLKIVRISHEMAVHDAQMTSLRQWWRRAERYGYGSLETATRFSHPEAIRQVRSARAWVGTTIVLLLAGLIGSVWTGRPLWGLAALACVTAAHLLQLLRVARKERLRCRSRTMALWYAVFVMLGKWPHIVGQWRYYLRGGRFSGGIMEGHKAGLSWSKEAR